MNETEQTKTESGKTDAQMIENEKKDDSKEPNTASPSENGNPEVENITLDDGICAFCDRKFETKKSLLRHLLISHRSVIEASKTLKCRSCNSEIDNMQKHLETVHNLKGTFCPICSKAFSDSGAVIDHFKMFHLQVIPKLTCAVCKMVYSKMEVLISHYQEKHRREVKQDSANERGTAEGNTEETSIYEVCIICENKFDTEESLSQHYIAVHHPYMTQSKTWKCSTCSTIFSTEEEMQNHLQAQHNVDKGFLTKVEASQHLKSIHTEVITKLSCSTCRLDFLNQADLMSHCESKHGNASNKTIDPTIGEPMMWRCKNCVTIFADTEEDMKKHLDMNHKFEGNWCPICSTDFDTTLEITDHMMKFHVQVIKQLTCVYCKFQCTDCDDLMSHYQVKHEDIAQKNKFVDVLCILCDTKFKTRSLMVKHCRSKHPQIFNEVKFWQCQMCVSDLVSEECMQKHMERKHNVNGNTCSICKINFETHGAALEHVKSSHVLMRTKPSCSICNTVMYTDTRLVIHFQEKHQLQQPSAKTDSTVPSISNIAAVQEKELSTTKEATVPNVDAVETATSKFQCYVCSQRFAFDLHLALHLTNTHKVAILDPDFEKQKFIICSVCKENFKTQKLANEHLNREHPGIRANLKEKYICSYCKMPFVGPHFRTHLVKCLTSFGPLRCRYCLVDVADKELLNEHVASKHPRPFSCPVCRKTFLSHAAALNHAKVKHPLRVRKNAPPVPLETTLTVTRNDGITYYKCPFCKYACPKLESITQHIYVAHEYKKDEISDPISMGMTQGTSQGTRSKRTSIRKRALE